MLDDTDQERRRWRERKRASRAREASEETLFKIALPEADTAEAMLRSERLTEAQALDHAKVEEQIEAVMRQWIGLWLAQK